MNSSSGQFGARLRFWWADQKVFLGLVLAFVFTAALCVVVLFPFGSTEIVTGTIEGVGLNETETGSYPVARVRLPDRVVAITLPRTTTCSIGSTVHLQKQQRVWGPAFTLDWTGCGRRR